MKKTIIPFILVFYCGLFSFAQLPVWQGEFAFSGDTVRPTDYVKVVSEYSTNSNSLSNSFMNNLNVNSFINSEDKQRELSNVAKNVRVGVVFDASVWYKHRLAKHNINIVFALRGRSFRAIELSKGAIDIALNGNTQYQGETANLAPTKLTNYIHQEIYLGAEKVFDKHGLMIGGGISIQKLSTYTSMEITQGSVYTAPYGKYIDFELQYHGKETRSASTNNLVRFEGLGATLSLYGQKQFKNNSNLSFELKDLGFIHVNEMRTNSVNINEHWEGVDVSDVITDSTAEIATPQIKSPSDVLNQNTEKKAGKLVTTGSVNVSYYRKINEKIYAFLGVKQYFTSAYIPRVYARPYYQVAKSIAIGVPVAFGGFGKLDVGLSLRGNIFKNYYYTVDANYVESLLNAKNSSGQGFNFGLSAMF